MNPKEIKTIYIIAICGTGMASLAGLLKEAGYRVTGSDTNVYPPMSTLLENAGIAIKPGYKKENITGEIDLVVNSPRGRGPRADGAHIRAAAQKHGLPLVTTGAAALAAANGTAQSTPGAGWH